MMVEFKLELTRRFNGISTILSEFWHQNERTDVELELGGDV